MGTTQTPLCFIQAFEHGYVLFLKIYYTVVYDERADCLLKLQHKEANYIVPSSGMILKIFTYAISTCKSAKAMMHDKDKLYFGLFNCHSEQNFVIYRE